MSKLEPSRFTKVKFMILTGMVTFAHFGVTFVVILFLLSTINILNDRLLQFESIKYIEVPLALALLVISATLYFKSFGKITDFIKKTYFRGQL